MPGQRGALPLALLIVAALGAGIALAVIRAGEEPGPKATPTVSPTTPVTPTTPESPTTPASPTTPGTPSPTGTPTTPESPSPTGTPTETPGTPETPGPTGTDATPGPRETPLAKTGGATAPWFLIGAALIGLSGALWRLARPRID